MKKISLIALIATIIISTHQISFAPYMPMINRRPQIKTCNHGEQHWTTWHYCSCQETPPVADNRDFIPC